MKPRQYDRYATINNREDELIRRKRFLRVVALLGVIVLTAIVAS